MATNITTMPEFRQLLPKNGEIASDQVLERAPVQLKKELIEAFELIYGLLGKVEDWVNNKNYVVGNFVRHKKKVYRCVQNNINKEPSKLTVEYWEPYASSGGGMGEFIEIVATNAAATITPITSLTDPSFNGNIAILLVNGVALPRTNYSITDNTINFINTALYDGDVVKVAFN